MNRHAAFAKIEYRTDFPVVVAAHELDLGICKPDATDLTLAHGGSDGFPLIFRNFSSTLLFIAL